MRIYTKTGDQGETGLAAGPRVSKDHPRVEACGTIDELNAALGLIRADSLPEDADALVGTIQNDLFAIGADLASPEPARRGTPTATTVEIELLEQSIDRMDDQLPALTEFILPTGTLNASAAHLARAICRRAERRVVTLGRQSEEHVSPAVVVYLNRLSDFLFVLARMLNYDAGQVETRWEKRET